MTGSDSHPFDLLTEPWLPVRTISGETVELSLREVFGKAHDLVAISGDLATQDVALLRLLLAVLHRAVGGPRDLDHWEQLWSGKELPHARIEDYLDSHRDRFALFHPETPFFQVAGLRTAKGETAELSKLIADVPNGHPFFTTRLGSDLSLSFAEAARWVVHCQAFDPSGIKTGPVDDPRTKGGRGYPIGTGWAGRVGSVLVEGATLRDTLLLNLIASDFGDTARSPGDDLPAWERPVALPGGTRDPSGPLDLYTWQARRIRLVPDNGKVTSVLICNGEAIDTKNRHNDEPLTAWRRSAAQEKQHRLPQVYMPRQHDPSRAIWRGLQSLLPAAFENSVQNATAASGLTAVVLDWVSGLTLEGALPGDFPLRLRTVGMKYGSKDAVTEDIVDDALSLHAVLLRQDAVELVGTVLSCVSAAEQAARALGQLALNVAQAAGKSPPKPSGANPSDVSDRDRATELAYGQLDIAFRKWIPGLGPKTDPTQAQREWHHNVKQEIDPLGDDILARAPAVAITGRQVGGRLVTAAHAQSWFYLALSKAIPMAFDRGPQGSSS
ncbi:type I-E CRISPR-associated protein Cse1/CasA [Prauserella marina]|uniref:CRISPR system Cascade subunit CasA n=1 Tax=Prauserella marina TaxID=530584 RepID=A0A222VMZ6_9PSEU|nr:type I-E CRISPR-associated protein Cse1/CasA [Prauserella marina]ASR35277.1 type I-E CRISPR-associated protein Cse1/CasA [Prauserella marina]PWV84947.1 CRISPR-associated Cse1 family protein [Prauserella marina]SDC08589.1 CRISPR system Cascade subunit CasA [Prauserella marina]